MSPDFSIPGPGVIKNSFNSAEHEILHALRYENIKKFRVFFSGSDKPRMPCVLLINVEMPTMEFLQPRGLGSTVHSTLSSSNTNKIKCAYNY